MKHWSTWNTHSIVAPRVTKIKTNVTRWLCIWENCWLVMCSSRPAVQLSTRRAHLSCSGTSWWSRQAACCCRSAASSGACRPPSDDDEEEEEEEAGASLAFSRRLHTPSVRPEPVPAVSAAADSSTERTVRTTMSVVFLFSNLRLLFRRLSSSRQDCRYRQYSAVIEISSFFFLWRDKKNW